MYVVLPFQAHISTVAMWHRWKNGATRSFYMRTSLSSSRDVITAFTTPSETLRRPLDRITEPVFLINSHTMVPGSHRRLAQLARWSFT